MLEQLKTEFRNAATRTHQACVAYARLEGTDAAIVNEYRQAYEAYDMAARRLVEYCRTEGIKTPRDHTRRRAEFRCSQLGY